jgi:hypothetical protein
MDGVSIRLVAAGAACLVLSACGGPSVAVEHSVLDVHVSGSWSGDLRSPRSFGCGLAGLNARWDGTLGDRIVELELIGIVLPSPSGTVHVPGGTTGGATMDPRNPGAAPEENEVAATITDQLSTERHGLGGTMVISGDGRSGSLDLHDRDLHLSGTWLC